MDVTGDAQRTCILVGVAKKHDQSRICDATNRPLIVTITDLLGALSFTPWCPGIHSCVLSDNMYNLCTALVVSRMIGARRLHDTNIHTLAGPYHNTHNSNCYTSNCQLHVATDRQVGSVARSEPLRISLVR